jgi:hypothetical protein
MSSDTLPEPNTHQRIFWGSHAGILICYINPIYIILNKIQLKISQW